MGSCCSKMDTPLNIRGQVEDGVIYADDVLLRSSLSLPGAARDRRARYLRALESRGLFRRYYGFVSAQNWARGEGIDFEASEADDFALFPWLLECYVEGRSTVSITSVFLTPEFVGKVSDV